jgi:ferric-dicitrate binding protein FerR (iron transport regulator)
MLEEAGRREEIPADDLAAIRSAAENVWRDSVRSARARRARVLAIAASFAIVVLAGILLFTRLETPGAAPAAVATCERVSGVVRVTGVGSDSRMVAGAVLRVGEEIEIGGGNASLRMGERTTLRLAAGTRVALESASKIELSAGSAYVDTDGSGDSLEVATAFGTARDVGTQFLVRVDAQAGTMEVAVREGEVVVRHGGRRQSVTRGEGLTVRSGGSSETRDVSPWSDEWGWVMEAAPRFEIEGRTLASYLDWVARETGLEIRYDESSVAVVARETRLHGSTGDLRPDEAVLLVLPGAGLEGQIVEGELRVRQAPR